MQIDIHPALNDAKLLALNPHRYYPYPHAAPTIFKKPVATAYHPITFNRCRIYVVKAFPAFGEGLPIFGVWQ
ncbi:MAG: hypothetical protein KTR17_03425, partial [Cellvibrionaceae bacterium]|nr:hypothetical protein [Cellvibrionaceae bacterium]